jgi:hypothetical protein
MRVSIYLRVCAVSILAFCFLALLDLDRRSEAGEPPLPAFAALGDRLHQEREFGPGGLVDEILLPLWPPGRYLSELQRRQRTFLPAINGKQQMEWEERISGEVPGLPVEERSLLWSLTMEPGYPEGLRALILRILDRGEDPRQDLAEVVRRGERSTAWEAAVRLGRRGSLEGVEVLEQAVRGWRGWGRQYAILGLVFLKHEGSAPVIREAAEDSSPSVRRHVALGLGELGDLRDVEVLDSIARRLPDPKTLKAVLHAKARLQLRNRPTL